MTKVRATYFYSCLLFSIVLIFVGGPENIAEFPSLTAQEKSGSDLNFDFNRLPSFNSLHSSDPSKVPVAPSNPTSGSPFSSKSGSSSDFGSLNSLTENVPAAISSRQTSVLNIPENSGIISFDAFWVEWRNNRKNNDSKISSVYDTENASAKKAKAAVVSNDILDSRDFSGKTRVGWLVIQLRFRDGYNIYSMTQKAGAMPTKIKIDGMEGVNGLDISLGPFFQLGPTVFTDLYGSVLEKLKGKTGWIAPLLIPDDFVKSGSFDFLPKSLKIRATLDALACTSGESGICNPVHLSFDVVQNEKITPAEIKTILTEAAVQQNLFTNRSKNQKKEDIVVQNSSSSNTTTPKVTSESPKTGTDNRRADRLSADNISSISNSKIIENGGFSIWVPIFAFLGGLILNIMPCVLPVIGLKIISFFQQAGQSRSRAFRLNLWYTGGILTVFLLLAFMSVGLSYLFTYGLFQIVMCLIIFAMALNMMGIWEIQLPAFLGGRHSNDLMEQEGFAGAYFKGIITTLLAIPCGAPLLSPTLAWTNAMIQQGRTVAIVPVYLLIGLGMASPYLLMGARPELLRFLPKPGVWMETFRSVMGFVLLGAVIWIIFSMPTAAWILPTMTVLFVLWFVCWFIGSLPFDASLKVRFRRWTISLLLLVGAVLISFDLPQIPMPFTIQSAVEAKMIRWAIRAKREGKLSQKHWKLLAPSDLKIIQQGEKTVIIDFTADWCPNCKVLENTILHTDDFLELIDKKGIVTLTADCTNQSAKTEEMKAINSLLDANGGRQVPTIMIFKPGQKKPEILRGLFTGKTLRDLLEEDRK